MSREVGLIVSHSPRLSHGNRGQHFILVSDLNMTLDLPFKHFILKMG